MRSLPKYNKEDVIAVSALCAVIFFMFIRVLIKGNSVILGPYYSDYKELFFYWRSFTRHAFAKGVFPLWNPYLFSGTPHLANIQQSLFYPFEYLFFFMRLPFAINFSVFFHLVLGAVLFYIWSRSLEISSCGSFVSATVFVLGATLMYRVFIGHLTVIYGMILFPAILLCIETAVKKKNIKYSFAGSLLLAVQIFAGQPQYPYFMMQLLVFYAIIRAFYLGAEDTGLLKRLSANLKYVAVLIFFGLMISCVQLLPTMELVANSIRTASTGGQYFLKGGMPFENLVTFLAPSFFGDSVFSAVYWGKGYAWEVIGYVGIFPLLLTSLAVLGPKSGYTKIFLWIALLSLMLSLGTATPLFGIYAAFVPFARGFREPGRFIFITTLCMAVLSGMGTDILFKELFLKKNIYMKTTLVFFVVVGLLFSVFMFLGSDPSFENKWGAFVDSYLKSEARHIFIPDAVRPEYIRDTFYSMKDSVLRAFLLLITGCIALLYLLRQQKLLKSHKVALCVLVLADLLSFSYPFVVAVDAATTQWPQEMVEILKDDGSFSRMSYYPSDGVGEYNKSLLYQISSIGGYDGNVIADYNKFVAVSQKMSPDVWFLNMGASINDDRLSLLNLKFMIFENEHPDHAGLKKVYADNDVTVYRTAKVLPRAFMVYETLFVDTAEDALWLTGSKDLDLSKQVVLQQPLTQKFNFNKNAENAVNISSYGINEVALDVRSDSDGVLVLCDTFYPGWKVFVDGQQKEILKADYTVRGVALTGGMHKVLFKFEPVTVKIGALVSGVGLLFVLVLFLKPAKVA